jgi:diketogulonate reductase-like aldo/keto reductase
MEIPVKTLQSGFSLPVYGLGTWQMGGRYAPEASQDEPEVEAIAGALDRGIRHIDTAEMYANGHSEELVGRAIQGRDRSKLIITTKVLAGMAGGYDSVLRAAEASLKRLGTDYIDLYLLHRAPGHSTADVMKALDRLVEQGMVKNIGVSNFTAHRVEAAQKLTANKIVCNQVHYSLRVREAEAAGLIEHARANDYLITAWGPLEKGFLDQGGILQALADKYSKTPYQVALNWIMAQPNVVAIPKTASLDHLDENLGALGWEIEPDDLAELGRNFPGQLAVSDRVPLDYPAEIPVK